MSVLCALTRFRIGIPYTEFLPKLPLFEQNWASLARIWIWASLCKWLHCLNLWVCRVWEFQASFSISWVMYFLVKLLKEHWLGLRSFVVKFLVLCRQVWWGWFCLCFVVVSFWWWILSVDRWGGGVCGEWDRRERLRELEMVQGDVEVNDSQGLVSVTEWGVSGMDVQETWDQSVFGHVQIQIFWSFCWEVLKPWAAGGSTLWRCILLGFRRVGARSLRDSVSFFIIDLDSAMTENANERKAKWIFVISLFWIRKPSLWIQRRPVSIL